MSTFNTYDFDVLLQISEREINDQLKAVFLSCDGGIPSGIDRSFDINESLSVRACVNFDIPTIKITGSAGEIKITIPFSNSQLMIDNNSLGPSFGGSITIINRIAVFNNARSASIGLNFGNGLSEVDVHIDNLTIRNLLDSYSNNESSNGLLIETVSNELASIGRIDFTNIPLGSYITDTFLPSNVEATTAISPQGNCLILALQMAYDREGDISQLNSYLISSGHSAAIIISSYWFLAHVIRPEVAKALGKSVDYFDKPLQLNQSILLRTKKSNVKITKMQASIVGEKLRVAGNIEASKFRFPIKASFFIDISFEIDTNGKLQPTASEPKVKATLGAKAIKDEIKSALRGLTSQSYSLGAIADEFEIASAQITDNLILAADFKRADMPENTPLVSIKRSWTEAAGALILSRVPGRFSQEVVWHGEFEASVCRAAFPINYEWFFNQEALVEGQNNQINTSHGALIYSLDANNRSKVNIEATSVGQRINGKLCVKLVDGKGRELSDCINISKSGFATRDDGRLEPVLPDIFNDWVNPVPIDPMQRVKINPDILASLMAREGVTTLEGLRKHLNLSHAEVAERLGVSESEYIQYEKKQMLR
ncbi:helix-turn-helix transcriptional regulator [Psychrobacter sp. H8-1]|uniref:helix-turn-helix domain-containing protein n=1 Tax=Psychrobacter sp. H8-1 TaxID=2774129 RepID=UPI001919EA9F|nr:helix-turn-helix transcriptional regulator [Psychrobacter sp. H8-1]